MEALLGLLAESDCREPDPPVTRQKNKTMNLVDPINFKEWIEKTLHIKL